MGEQTTGTTAGKGSGTARNGLLAAMVFLVALNLRPAIVAVGPLLEGLGRDLGWGEGTQGLLAALPLLAFAAMSPLVRFVTACIGENMTVLVALVILAAGTLVRSAGGPALVWVGTVVIGCAIAVGNVLVPAIVKRDYPVHVSLASAVSSSCITAGSAAASLTAVWMAARWGGWRAALAFWAVPALVVAVVWGVRIVIQWRRRSVGSAGNVDALISPSGRFACHEKGASAVPATEQSTGLFRLAEGGKDANAPTGTLEVSRSESSTDILSDSAPSSLTATCARGKAAICADDVSHVSRSESVRFPESATPLWRRAMTWWVTAFMGLQSAAFYTMTNWLPTLSTSVGETAATASRQLFVFQLLGVICGLFIPRLMQVRGNQVTAALVASLPMVAAGLGLMLAPTLTWVWACLAGCGQGAALVVALALIAMRGRGQAETVALSGIAQSIGYLIASIGPSLFGLLAERTGGFAISLAFFTALAALQCAVAFVVGREEVNGLR